MDAVSPTKQRWTVAVDVDGVIHSYTSGWQGADVLPDPPVPGAIEWLEAITEDFDVAVCSTRATSLEGCAAIESYLRENGLSERAMNRIRIEPGKPPALLYVDDRAWRFTGDNFPTADEVHKARPWWKDSAWMP